MKLIIAEKPSVAKNIAEALNIKTRNDGYFEGGEYIVTWAFGHLVQLYDAKDYDEKMSVWSMANFPFIPSEFKYKVKSSSSDKSKEDAGASKQLKIISKLSKRSDVDMVISACDLDREGEVIGTLITQYLQVKKPVYRLLLNEWTPDEVLKGLKNIIPIENMEPLKEAGISRQWADWVIGINLTTATTLKYQVGKGQPLNVGRVLMPTLKMVYDRCKEIEEFKPQDYYKLSATFKTGNGEEYVGVYIDENNDEKDKFNNREDLDIIAEKINNANGVIVDKDVELKKEYPPYLFNLTALQGYITSKYSGWSSDKVLKVCQGLYEKKFITYPRTASVVLEESLVDRAKKVLEVVIDDFIYKDEVKFKQTKRVFDSSKVDSHSAIIPTYIKPESLSNEERIVYEAIKNRFISQFMPVAEYEETKVVTKISDLDLEGVFVCKGKVQKVEGWKKIEGGSTKDIMLPNLEKNEVVKVLNGSVTTHETTPPKLHNEKSILRLMESCGKKVKDDEFVLDGFSIGTPATRAETISKLKEVGYIEAKGKSLVVTDLGRKFVEQFPVKDLFDLNYTGQLEKKLNDIEKSKLKKDEFLDEIFTFVKKSVELIKSSENKVIRNLGGNEPTIIGSCPSCGKNVVEGLNYYICEGYRDKECSLVVGKKMWGATISKSEVKKILAGDKTKEFSFKNIKDGVKNEWTAALEYSKEQGKIVFAKRDIKEIAECPTCKGKVLEGKDYYVCENYKKKCNLVIPKSRYGAEFTDRDVRIMLSGDYTDEKDFIITKDGQTKKWRTKVGYDSENNRIIFPNRERKELCLCPKCGGVVTESASYYICSNYKKTCDAIIPKIMNGATISSKEAIGLFQGDILSEKEFTWKNGKKGKAKLKFKERLEFIF